MTDTEEGGARPGFSIIALARRYPLVVVVLVAGLVTAVFALLGLPLAAQWTATVVAVSIAGFQAVRMVKAAARGRWGLDILAILAISSTALLGDYWASLIVALMMTGGEALEDYGSARARVQLRALLAGAPHHARRVSPAGDVEDVDVDALRVDDVVLLPPGEVVPVDGILLDDEADFDESSLTGESLPVTHHAGSTVMSGSINGSSAVRMRVAAIASESQYQQVVALVARASESRGPFVRMADRLAVPFTVIALTIAGAAWAISGEATRFAEVLVVATPCPLLIAAPVAFVAGMGRAAREGVVIKSSESLERLAGPRTVAFDKTGTLTRGAPAVSRIDPCGTVAPAEVLALAAGVERTSNHVLARAIVVAAEESGVSPASVGDIQEVTAFGMSGVLSGSPVRVGRASFVGEGALGAFERALSAGEMAVYVGVDGQPVGRIVLRDDIRPESAGTILALRSVGVRHIVMVTGDAEATAMAVADAVGIDHVRAGLLPAEKVRVIDELPDRPVLMVGDGVNDAPVLAAADVGIAMGARGSTAASDTADVVVILDDLSRVAAAVETSRRTVRIARQSIALGIGLSIVFMLVAATGVLPAVAGALVQEAIDIATIVNGLRAGRGRSSGMPSSRVDMAAKEPSALTGSAPGDDAGPRQ